MRPSSPRLALAVVFFVFTLAVGFTLLPLSFASPRVAHAEPLAPAAYTVTGTASVPDKALFKLTPNLNHARAEHSATLLPDGRVLIVGGAPEAISNTVELYDPATVSVTKTVNTLRGRMGHTATLLPNGQVLIVGGHASAAYAELYDPASGIFTPTGNLNYPRARHTATLLPDGKVLIAGGNSGDTWSSGFTSYVTQTELYDWNTGTFTLTGPLSVARYNHTATLLPNGQVMIAGGVGSTVNALSSVELYTPGTGQFTAAPSMRQTRTDHTASLLENGKVLFLGGNRTYDPSTGSEGGFTAELYDWAGGESTSLGNRFLWRQRHTATVLPNGIVVVVGSCETDHYTNWSSQRVSFYRPDTDQVSHVYVLSQGRCDHEATLLQDGRMLLTGGRVQVNAPSLKLTALGSFLPANTFTGTLTVPARWVNSRTVSISLSGTTSAAPLNGYVLTHDFDVPETGWLPASNGQVINTTRTFNSDGDHPLYLFLRDTNEQRARIFRTNVGIDTTPPTASMTALAATSSTAIPLAWNGSDIHSGVAHFDVEVRVGTSGAWSRIATATTARSITYNAATRGRTYYFRVRATDKVGNVGSWPGTHNAFTRVSNAFTGSLQTPGGWLTSASGPVTFSGNSEGDPVSAASLSNNGSTWGAWISASPGVAQTVTWNFGADGANKPVYLRFRDTYGDISSNIISYVNVDTKLPASTMTALGSTSPTPIQLAWSGTDATSGVANYDLEARDGPSGTWQPVLSATTATSTNFNATPGHTYYFRVRARDHAGHVEAWPSTHDTYTTVDTEGPTGSVSINKTALATTAQQVTLYLPASDALSTVTHMRLRVGGTWEAWQPYASPFLYTLPAGDGNKTVYAQYRDQHGNVSAQASDTIRLDEAAGTHGVVTINSGALWTNSTSVILTISAPARTAEMMVRNDGGLAGVNWQPFDTRPDWVLAPYDGGADPLTVWVRVRNMDGTVSADFHDTIKYDPEPPTGNATIQSMNESHVLANLTASDNLSGVAAMRVALAGDFAQAEWEPFTESKRLALGGVSPNDVQLVVQFRDSAGNVSERLCVTPGGTTCAAGQQTFLWLPLVQRR
jgi:hypothetical protein